MNLKARRLAVIDIGTNSVRMFAVEFENDEVHILGDTGEVTRLGASLPSTGTIGDDDRDRTVLAVADCISQAADLGVVEVEVIGTEVFRASSNGREVAGDISRETGRAVRILSETEEAEASYLGVVGWEEHFGPEPVLVVDVGGGSTELVLGEGVALTAARSVPAGALRVTESYLKHDPPRPDEVQSARAAVQKALEPLGKVAKPESVVGPVIAVGGTACAVAAWVHQVIPYRPADVHGQPLSRSDLEATIAAWSEMTLAERMEKGKLGEGRARVVLGGALILAGILELLETEILKVSTRGLRHGLILRRLLLA